MSIWSGIFHVQDDHNNSKIYKEGKNEKEDFVTCINSRSVS